MKLKTLAIYVPQHVHKPSLNAAGVHCAQDVEDSDHYHVPRVHCPQKKAGVV